MSRSLLKRALIVTLVALACIVASASVVEQMIRRGVIRQYPAPGQLVSLDGGRRIQLDCRGSGSPTVVLESGLDLFGSLAWASVQDSIARSTRVCSYSRAGILWSDAAAAFSADRVARDLHSALQLGGEKAPFVMVGHSIGGPYVMTYTRLFATEVSGIVFVDASHPDQFRHFHEATGKDMAPSSAAASVGAALSWTGLLRLLPPLPVAPDITTAFFPTTLPAVVDEMRAVPTTLARAGAFRALGSRPLIVLSATLGPSPDELEVMGLGMQQAERLAAAKRVLQKDLATWSSNSRQLFVDRAGHYIQLDRPDVVIDAVREVLARARS
jgi:pimeloyl-ACP methyl ester carboxylesterase